VSLDGVPLERWRAAALDLHDLSTVRDAAPLPSSPLTGLAGPVFAFGSFDLDAPADLFLRTRHWGKGSVWINGFNIGRYWSRGPQHTLYVPSPIVRAGVNEIAVLELQSASAEVRFVPRPDLGHTDY
jgi:beta-galactosidase